MTQEKNNGIVTKDMFAELRMTETSQTKMYGSDKYRSPIYGNQIPTNDPAAAFDDRYFQRSVMRFSPYFERIRKARENARLYTKTGLFPERYNEEFPMTSGDLEIYCPAVLEICDDYKRISLNCGADIVVYSDSTVYLHNVSRENSDLFLSKDGFVPSVDLPYCDFLISKGIEPEIINRNTRIQHFEDSTGEDGGTMSLCFEISSFGNVLSNTSLDLKLVPKNNCDKLPADNIGKENTHE